MVGVMNGHSVSDSSRVWHELVDVSHCKGLQHVFTFLLMHPRDSPTTDPSKSSNVVPIRLFRGRPHHQYLWFASLFTRMSQTIKKVPEAESKPRTGPDAQSDHVYVCDSGRQEDAENWARCTV